MLRRVCLQRAPSDISKTNAAQKNTLRFVCSAAAECGGVPAGPIPPIPESGDQLSRSAVRGDRVGIGRGRRPGDQLAKPMRRMAQAPSSVGQLRLRAGICRKLRRRLLRHYDQSRYSGRHHQ